MLSRSIIRRITCATVAAETSRLRGRGLSALPSGDWPEETLLGDEGLGLDSLERLGAIGSLVEAFRMESTTPNASKFEQVRDWIDWVESSYDHTRGHLAVFTSGSTGLPKLCVHTLQDLVQEADHIRTLLPDCRRVIALVPAHHLYGIIWTAFLPAALNVPVVSSTVVGALDMRAGDLVVAVPEQWHVLLRLCRRFPPGVVGVSSAGMLDETLAAELLTAGLGRLVDVYGSSETGAIALREFPAIPHELLPRWDMVAVEDDWQLADRQGRLFDLPDHIERAGPRSLRPVERRDGAVQIGGHNVWPARVAATLRQNEGVADIAVRLGSNGRLKAFVVPSAGMDPAILGQTLERTSMEQLSDVERPKAFAFGTAVPRNDMGKAIDWA